MKKQFQSKSVPRGTRTIWRYLGALFILFTFAIGNVWAADYLINVESGNLSSDSKWYQIASVGGVTNKTGSTWDEADVTCSPAGAKIGSKNFTVRTDLANTTQITVVASSGSNRTISGVKTGSSLSSLTTATGCTSSGSVTKNNCGQVLTFTFSPALSAGTYVNIAMSGNMNVHSVTITAGAATKHHVTYKLNGATGTTPTQADVAEGAKFTLHNGKTGITAPTNKDFDGWHDGTKKYAGSAEYTMGTSDVELTAQWVNHVAKYTVIYKDGTTELGSETVEVGHHPTGSEIAAPTKDCYTFADWSPALDEVSGTDGATVYVDATWTPKYASTLDFAAITTAGTTGSNPIGTFLASGNMVASNLGSKSGWETSTGKSGFIGYKLKNTSAVVKFLVKAGKEVEITLGSVGAAATLSKGGVDSQIAKADGDNAETVIPAFVAEADMLVTITTSSDATVTLKKISIVDPATKYTVTYALNGATGTTPTEVSHKEGEKFNLHDGATGITAPTNKTFVNWKDQDDALFDGGAEYTMPAKNVTLTAQWAGDVYTVKFMDGETVLDTKVVEVGSHPTDIEHPTKPLYTFAAWQLSGSDVILDEVSGAKDAVVTLTARWAVAYASNVNFKEAATQDLGVETALNTYHYASDAGDISFEAKGLKIKTDGARFYFNVAPGKVAEIKFGNISGATYSVDGGAAETLTSSQLKATYSASAQSCVMTMTTAAYNIVEKVTIHDPYTVSFDANGGDDVASLNGTPSVTLPLPVKGTESFLGWFIGEDKIGEAGDSYTPTADVELVAHWEAVSTDARLASIEFSAAGTLSPAFDPEVTNYTYTMPYGTAAIPTITGATSVNAKAQDPIIGEAAAAWGEAQTVKGVAQSGDKKTYTITMAKAPKDGVCIVKADLAAGSSAASITATSGAYKDADNIAINVAKDLKLGGTGAYVKVAVKDTYFQDGDVVEIVLRTDKSASAWLQIFADEGTTLVAEMKSGVSNATPNHLTISGVPENTSALYLYRTEAADGDMNPYPTSMAVYRAMNPVLTAITIDERAGVIDPLDDKHFNVQIPYEADLANLTIVPTIAWNAPAAEGSIVVNNGGAWVEGNNTYKLTDKDGDYTVYTLTLTRDQLKHAVRFMDGEEVFASALVVDGESPVAPATDPTKEDYLFQGWAETVDGDVITDWSAISISAAKDFYAKWVSDGAIKLIEAGAINTTNFVTGGTLSSGIVSVDEVDYKYITLAGTNGEIGSASNVTTDRFVMYHATTTKTKIQIHAYANGNARQVRLSGLVEGASTLGLQQTINVAKNDDELTEYFSFDSDKHRTFYITIPSSASDVYLLQVKVIESGEPLAAIGTAGTSFNFNKGRLFAPQSVATSFDGIDIKTYNKYAALSTEYAELSAGAISFYVPNDVCLSVASNANGTNKYYVTNEVTGTDNETTTANAEFNLTGGKTWYIRLADSSKRVRFTNIAFTAPKCEKPTITPMVNVEYCEGDVFAPMVVSASVGDGGSLHYAWFKEAGETDEAVGTDNASFTPLTDGEYYVIVTNQLADHSDNSETSNTITVEHFASAQITTAPADVLKHSGLDVTLSVVATGKNVSYEWFACDDAEGNNPVAFAPAQTGTSLLLENIEAGVKYYKVLVSSDCGTASAVAKVEGFDDLPLQDVTGNMTWDFSKANDGTAAGSNLCNEAVLVNVSGINNNDDFKSAYLKATANKFKNGKLQASMIKFHTTVDGMITVVFSNTGGKDTERYLTVNGRKTDKGSKNETAVTYTGFVYAGDVELGVVEGDGNMLNFTSVAFKATVDYPRTDLNPSFLGTLCWTNNAILGGATLYEFAGKDEYNKLVFDEVAENRLEAGKPYIFMPENGNTEIKLYNTDDAEPLTTNQAHVNHMYGTIVATDLYPTTDVNMYYFSSNHIWAVKDFTVEKITVPAYYCYVDYPAVLAATTPAPAPAPGRRRVTMGVQGEQVVTGVENLNASEQPVKLLINGQIFILRGEKMYDATGRLVK